MKNVMPECRYIAEPVVSPDGALLAVEVLTRFFKDGAVLPRPDLIIQNLSLPDKSLLIHTQIDCIELRKSWFESNNITCSVNVDNELAELIVCNPSLNARIVSMPFIALEISECFNGLRAGVSHPVLGGLTESAITLWLDDMGAGDTSVRLLRDGLYHVVKLDRFFFKQCIKEGNLEEVVRALRVFCDKIIVEGVDDICYIAQLKRAGVWGIQGYVYPCVALEEIEYQNAYYKILSR